MSEQPMLKFVSLEREMPQKRSAGERAQDFSEIYAEFAREKAAELLSRLPDLAAENPREADLLDSIRASLWTEFASRI